MWLRLRTRLASARHCLAVCLSASALCLSPAVVRGDDAGPPAAHGQTVPDSEMLPLTPAQQTAREALARRMPKARLLWTNGGRMLSASVDDWRPRALTPPGDKEERPRWSPDGTKVLFVRTPKGKGQKPGVWLMNADFAGRREIIAGAHTADFCAAGGAVTAIAADGYRVLRHDLAKGTTEVLYDARNPPGNGLKVSQAAELSPNGRFLLMFTAERGHSTFVYDLQARRYIGNRRMAGGDCSPAWSPDGRYLLTTARSWVKSRGGRPVVKADFDPGTGRVGESRYFVGNGWCHFQRVSNDGNWVVFGQRAGKARRIMCWRRGTPPEAAVRVSFLRGENRHPALFVPNSVRREPDSPIDHLQLSRLSPYRGVLAQSSNYTRVLRQLSNEKDPEAALIVKTVEALGQAKLHEARDAHDAFQARALYLDVAARFEGHALGNEANEALRQPGFQQELAAAPKLERLRELATRLRAVAGAKARFADGRYLARNKAVLVQMVDAAASLRTDFARTKAARAAGQIAKTYGLPASTSEAGNEQLVIAGTLEAISPVPDPARVVYPDMVTYARYRVDKVLTGSYPQKGIVVVHWGMRKRKHTAAAQWKPGVRHKLVLDLFESHRDLETVNAAQDAYDDLELVPYWALNVSDRE